jgi:hypothetical protein
VLLVLAFVAVPLGVFGGMAGFSHWAHSFHDCGTSI